MKINFLTNYTYPHSLNSSKSHSPITLNNQMQSVNLNNLYFRDYLMFKARVEKSLKRFYETNKGRMPVTLKNYIDANVPDECKVEPIDAQFHAFEDLLYAENVQDVKELYPEEPLFKSLIPISETNASRGILHDIKIMLPDLKEAEEVILKSGEDFSIYLLKKIFLEAKSLPDINKDLDEDLNPVFQNPNKTYISYSTLKALGIQLPNNDFLTSLRYTKEGYSDEMAKKISSALANHPRVRTVHANPTGSATQKFISSLDVPSSPGSSRRSHAQKARWAKLSPAEKTEAIEKMQTGSELHRFAMIDAWNSCDELRIQLSQYLSSKALNKVEGIIYKSTQYSQYLSEIMTEFWRMHPEYGETLGDAISSSYEKVKKAYEDGNFDNLKTEITNAQKEKKEEIRIRLTKINKTKNHPNTPNSKSYDDNFEYFKDMYSDAFKFIPQAHLNDFFAMVQKTIKEPDMLRIWADSLQATKVTGEISKLRCYLKQLKYPLEHLKTKLAMELALMEVLYEASDRSYELYSMDYSDLTGISRILFDSSDDDYPIGIATKKIGDKSKTVTILKSPNFSKLESLYQEYTAEPSREVIEFLEKRAAYAVGKGNLSDVKIGDYAQLRRFYETIGTPFGRVYFNYSLDPLCKKQYLDKLLEIGNDYLE